MATLFLDPALEQLINVMCENGAELKGKFFIISDHKTLKKFTETYPDAYDKASKLVPPTENQILLCEEAIDKGATYTNDIYKTMKSAYQFIGENRNKIKSFNGATWASRTTMTPDMKGVPNH